MIGKGGKTMYVFVYPFFVKIIKPDGRYKDRRPLYVARAPDLNLLVFCRANSLNGIYTKAEEALYWLLYDRLKYKEYIPLHNTSLCTDYLQNMNKNKTNWLYIIVKTKIDLENDARPDIAFISRRLNIIRLKTIGHISSGIYND